MIDIREQIERLRVPVAYGPVGAQKEREDAADTMEKMLAENERLRKIAAHVPGKIYIAAKEAAGFANTVAALEQE